MGRFKIPVFFVIPIVLLIAVVYILEDSSEGEVEKFGIIVKSADNMYNQELINGFKEIVESSGYQVVVGMPETTDVIDQINIVNTMIDENVSCIAISGNDENALETVLTNAMDKGIKVLSFDASINSNSRLLHVNQADPIYIARLLLDQAENTVEGDIAILSATAQSHNQNTWIYYMRHFLENGEYNNLHLVDIKYGDDDYYKSVKRVNQLIDEYEDLSMIIAPTAIGIVAASETINNKNLENDIKVTGLGLPSQMHQYIGDDKVCQAMFLWNPIEVGKLTAYASLALTMGDITGKSGEVLEIEGMGNYEVIDDAYGGTEIILQSETMRFDANNIDDWKVLY